MDLVPSAEPRLYWWYVQSSRFLVLFLIVAFLTGPYWFFWSVVAALLGLQLSVISYSILYPVSPLHRPSETSVV